MTLRIGIDLGGTNLRGAAFEGPLAPIDPTPQWSHREEVGDDREPAAVIDRVATVVERLASNTEGQISVGVGLAAMLCDRQGTVARSPHLKWRDVPFGVLLAKRLGSRFRLAIYNDVNAITWGEYVAGAGRGCDDLLAVYVGTGIGAGAIVGGRLLEGADGCAGELGHTKVRWDDAAEPCACGGRGCVEAYAGGSYIERRIARELEPDGKSKPRRTSRAVVLAGDVDAVTPSHVDRAAAEGDEWALGMWTEIATLLAVSLGNALAVLDSRRLVLGGGLLSRTPTLADLVQTTLLWMTPAPILERLEVVPAELGDSAGLVGAAALAAAGPSISV